MKTAIDRFMDVIGERRYLEAREQTAIRNSLRAVLRAERMALTRTFRIALERRFPASVVDAILDEVAR